MTDKEMAIALGKRILDLKHEKAALAGILCSMKQANGLPVPWEKMRDDGVAELKSSPTSLYKYGSLEQAIPDPDGHSSALEELYRHFFEQEA